MNATVLITLGRLPKGLELARALAGAGHRVLVADPFPSHLTRWSRAVARTFRVTAPDVDRAAFLDDLRRIVVDEDVKWVVPVSEEILHVAALAEDLPADVRFFGEAQPRLLELHDKLRFARLVESLGLPAPPTFDALTPEARTFAQSAPFVVKPMLGSSGHDLSIHAAGDAVPSHDRPMLLQAYLPGEEFSTFSIAHAGRVIGTVVYRARILSGTVAVCFERIAAPDERVLEWIEAFCAGRGSTGFVSFDFRRDQDGAARVMECNPRTTSGIHFVHPEDLARAIVDPDAMRTLRFREEAVLQQFFPALTATQAAALRGRPWRQNLRWLFGCRDVSWQRRDPLPFLLMTPASWPILKRTVFEGLSFGEATTQDIGWYDDSAL